MTPTFGLGLGTLTESFIISINSINSIIAIIPISITMMIVIVLDPKYRSVEERWGNGGIWEQQLKE